MITLARDARRGLETTVKTARKIAEAGARKIIDERLRVGDAKPPGGLSPDEQRLRVRLRAHGRQLGDQRDPKGVQTTHRLVAECAYEHWHRMLFARFLAETDLLIEPQHGIPISLEECHELARERGQDWLTLASAFAVRMLPQIFRPDDPVLEIGLPPETRSALEDQLKSLPRDVFLADDSLGWVYQFWQADEKERVNRSETKIGADELPAVTQLFTEDYMVLFLLHNTLGAWWAGKKLTAEDAESAENEAELRRKVSLPGVDWEYLRFVREDVTAEGAEDRGENEEVQAEPSPAVPRRPSASSAVKKWRPAAGTFAGWPKSAREITVLDPCMGSGHFLVFALPILVALRMEEERLSRADAVDAVLRDNLHGLEIDPRCTQIAAFNLALAAWKLAGYHELPPLQLACSGLTPAASEEEWLQLADQRGMDRRTEVLAGEFIRDSLRYLHKTFSQAPTLGSLIDPTEQGGGMFSVDFDTLRPYLSAALAAEEDDEAQEQAVAAAGMVKAAELLAGEYVLVITNVPYLGRGKQDETLQAWADEYAREAKADLATMFISRGFKWLAKGGSLAVVSPQNWLFLTSYKKLRERLLREEQWDIVARLGPGAFETIGGHVVNVALLALTHHSADDAHVMLGLDASIGKTPSDKAALLRGALPADLRQLPQAGQRKNADVRVMLGDPHDGVFLSEFATSYEGMTAGDLNRYVMRVWEVNANSSEWARFAGASETCSHYAARKQVIRWCGGDGPMQRDPCVGIKGREAWGRRGVRIHQTGTLSTTLYDGDLFDKNGASVVPKRQEHLEAVYAFCESPEFRAAVKGIDPALKVTIGSMVKVPFDLAHWQKVAAEKYPNGLPEPESDDPTQWLFHGRPEASEQPLQVAVARLLGYRWPAELDGDMRLSQRARDLVRRCEELLPHADADGIVCLTPIKGEASAADRLTRLLADAYGSEWSAGKLDALLRDVGYAGKSLDDWLRDGFFENHCEVFHNRPFIWHIWDGRRDGFHALVNYHKLCGDFTAESAESRRGKEENDSLPSAPRSSVSSAVTSSGRRTLEKLIYTYLGDWIERQEREQKAGLDGADARLAAARHLRTELENILKGEPPYDLFIRWKPLHQQPIGWEPDINDGVRLNIRPFMTARPLGARARNACILRVTPKNIKWTKDRGKEPQREKADFPWFWSWDETTQDFQGGAAFDGNRWNDLHYSNAVKQAAREGAKAKGAKS